MDFKAELKVVHRFVFLIMFLLPLQVFPESFSPVNVIEAKWGFDGKVVPNKFNQLCVLLANDSEKPFDGTIILDRTMFQSSSFGAEYFQPVYIAPHSRKWIVFSPMLNSNCMDGWTVRWGKGKDDQFKVNNPDSGFPAIVFIGTPTSLYSRPGMHVFPDMLFPSSVALTDGLDAAVIAEQPSLSPYQADAFMDWLSGGGLLYVIHGPDGKFPVFSGKLEALNKDANEFRINAGKVVKLPVPARNITFEFMMKSGYVYPTVEKKKAEEDDYGYYYNYENYTEQFQKFLQNRVKTDHNWPLIYISAVIYLILVAVVNLIIGRKSKDYRKPIIFFAVCLVGFSAMFAILGMRGYGEKSVVNDISYARSLGDGRFDVSQWFNVFVTSGDYYTITHPEELRYYASGTSYENTRDLIYNGKDGFFKTEIPLYSSVNIVHRGMIQLEKSGISVKKLKVGEDRINEFHFKLGESFDAIKVMDVWAKYKNELNYMSKDSSGAYVNYSNQKFNEYIRKWTQDHRYMYYSHNTKEDPLRIVKDTIVPALICTSRGGPGLPEREKYVKDRFTDSEAVEVFILAETPKAFQVSVTGFKGRHGYTLYHFSVYDNKKQGGKNE